MMIVIDIKGVKMRFVFVPLNLIGYAYGEMYDFVWQELLNNGYLNSAILFGVEEKKDDVVFDWFNETDNFGCNDIFDTDVFY
jgi:hypothetical protein